MVFESVLVSVLLVGLVGSAGADLAPKKPSQLVTLRSLSTACSVGSGVAMDTRILPDGSSEPFLVPSGEVLVITAVSWSVVGSVGEDSEILLRIGSGAVVFHASTLVDSLNNGSGNATVPNVVAAAGGQVCVENVSGAPATFANVTVHGFFAKDK